MKRIPKEHYDAMIQNYMSGMSSTDAAALLGYERSSLCRELKRRGIARRTTSSYLRKFSDKQESEMISLYHSGNSTLKIAAQIGEHYQTVWDVLRRHGVETRSKEDYRIHTLNERYFETIDTEEKAYWLGFLTADGCVTGNSIKIQLQARDSQHLQKFASALSTTASITEFERYTRRPQGGGYTGTYAGICVNSKRMSADLFQLGVTPRKSLTVKPWEGPDDLMSHYWRGLIDGDGCIHKYDNREITGGSQWMISLVGSEWVVKAFAAWAAEMCGTKAKALIVGNIFKVTVGGLSIARNLILALYKDASISLNRKTALATELIDIENLGTDRVVHYLPKTQDGLYIGICPACNKERHFKHPNFRRYDGRCPSCRKGNRNDIVPDTVRREYESGSSTCTLAKKYSVSDGVIARKIREAGGTIRNFKDAQANNLHNVRKAKLLLLPETVI